MKKHIICFGDSNTHGYCADRGDCADGLLQRFNEEERYPCLLQKFLGDEYLVIEEGLPGRTTVFEDPLHEGMCGLNYIYPCLKSHEPVSLLVIMLGTNDTKERFSANAFTIGIGMERLLKKAMSIDCWGPDGKPNILVVAPPPIGDAIDDPGMGAGCAARSKGVSAAFREVCQRLGLHFMDAAEEGITFNEIDYMHLTRRSHSLLAERLASAIPGIIR